MDAIGFTQMVNAGLICGRAFHLGKTCLRMATPGSWCFFPTIRLGPVKFKTSMPVWIPL